MKGLIIKKHWLDLILSGQKVWEIRGSNTKIRGVICLIESGTGEIKGTVELYDSHPVNAFDLKFYKEKHCIQDLALIKYGRPHAWVMRNTKRFDNPIPYKHPRGAVIWVNLPDNILEGVRG